MQVNIKFSNDLTKNVEINLAWDLFHLYQQGAQMAGENITAERISNWNIVENALKSASEGDLIDFSLLGDIYFENGKAGFPDDEVN